MNDKTLDLLEKLSNKLGVASEYLWAALLKQAFINSIENVVVIVFTIILGVALYKFHRHFMVDENKMSYRYYEDALIFPMAIGAALFIALTVLTFCWISDTINGFFNPEIYAIQYILKNLK